MSASHCGENNELHPPARVPVCRLVEHPKLATKNSALDWKLPNRGSCHVSPEVIVRDVYFINFFFK